mgnify:CR=1 FL=1
MLHVTKSFLPDLKEYVKYLEKIWDTHHLTNDGPFVKELEYKLGEFLEVENFIFVTNGTIALQLAIKALGLNGNVLTCQNVSPVSTNPAGISHKLGHISDLSSTRLDSATHWSDRKECPNCPVVHICKGACMFLSGPLWDASCDNAFSDNIIPFCIAIEEITGCIPEYIEGPLREDRKDIFWWVKGKPEKVRKPKKRIKGRRSSAIRFTLLALRESVLLAQLSLPDAHLLYRWNHQLGHGRSM